MPAEQIGPPTVVEYWFGRPPYQPRGDLWWRGGKQADREIARRFGQTVEQALRGELGHWAGAPDSALALVLLLDQFTRNIYRGTPRAFAGDDLALALTLAGIEAGFLNQLHYLQAVFFCLPLEHSESLAMQDRCVAEIEQLISSCADDDAAQQLGKYLDHATEHRDIVRRFGRFPHRNQALDRDSSEAEREYLEQGAKRFGQ